MHFSVLFYVGYYCGCPQPDLYDVLKLKTFEGAYQARN